MSPVERNWVALAEEVRARRAELELTHQDIAASGGPSRATMSIIENAQRDAYQKRILGKLEAALRWQPGTVRAILDGADRAPAEGTGAGTALQYLEATPGLSSRDLDLLLRFARVLLR